MSSDFTPTEADLEEAYRTQLLNEAARLLEDSNNERYEAAIHGLKYVEAPNETK